MATALVDSNVLIAAASARDTRHEIGRAIVSDADRGDLPGLQVTNYVLSETLNYLTQRAGKSQATEFYDRLDESAGFEFVRSAKTDDRTAIDLFRSVEPLSFVDAAIGAYAARTGTEYCYSFDDGLDALEDVARLDSSVDPYRAD